ncbi:DUF6370 family protein [Limnoglobus roseus]|uniref:Uncharacterized protein n=1 Tax=Limnoglobus roseus TaxID=2598579 RepID=A0A5C1AED6_9BACT|nr:DUF6370 family protein [Limnoglobus roseus]QEL16567.1 hypothetical protein PX52LOC_03527 [Limnoglobus roseus]
MRSLLALAVGLMALSFSVVALAEDAKKGETKKLEGKLTCTKCALQETDKCGHALKVKEGDKEVIYYLDDKGGAEKYHGKVCKEDHDATVEGKVVEKDKKHHVESPKVTLK